jgi:hypothetical protein
VPTKKTEAVQLLLRSRIVGHATVDPSTLEPHPLNWRVHTKKQARLVEESITRLGWIETGIQNKRTGRLLDGHLRREIAIKRKWEMPVTIVDLTEQEEELVLALYDAIGAMATKDQAKLSELLAEANKGEQETNALRMLAEFYGELPTEYIAPEPSESNLVQTRQMQIRLDDEGLATLNADLELLAERYGTVNQSETALEAFRRAGKRHAEYTAEE